MTIHQFMTLNKYKQEEMLWKSTFLAQFKEGDCTKGLFWAGDFFIEIIYKGHLNKVTAMIPFENRQLLEPYWEAVSLEEISGLV